MKATERQIAELKEIVTDYLISEFGSEKEKAENKLTDEDTFADIHNIPMGCTENEPYYWQEDKYGIAVDVQGYVDIENFVLKKEIASLIFEESFETFERFREFLRHADFGDYTAVDDNEWNEVFESEPDLKPDWWEEYCEVEGI